MREQSDCIRNFENVSKFHMCEHSSHIREVEGTESSRMSSINLTLRDFESNSKSKMCESDSHIQLKTPNISIMGVFR